MPASDVSEIDSMLVYARNGYGKTWLVGSASEVGKTLIIDCEKSSTSIRKKYPKADVFKLTEFPEIDEIYWYLANGHSDYDFVAIDPLSRLQSLCMRHVLQERDERDLSAEPNMPDRQSWGKTGELMKGVILNFRDLPAFTIFTAYERRRDNNDTEWDDDSQGFTIGPEIQPAVKTFLLGAVDLVGRLYVKMPDEPNGPIEYRMRFGQHDIFDTKDRSSNLPRIMRSPTMAKIMERIRS